MSDKTKRTREPRPDPSTQPAQAPYEPAGRAWRGIDMGGSDETLSGAVGGQAPESDEGATAYAAEAGHPPQPFSAPAPAGPAAPAAPAPPAPASDTTPGDDRAA